MKVYEKTESPKPKSHILILMEFEGASVWQTYYHNGENQFNDDPAVVGWCYQSDLAEFFKENLRMPW